ncbi:AbrB family transcriptional regulator [Thalassovita taeanensis]|uniref:Membrane protein AbrB duplication n=1 Tax=Thalassovita taeanensis TaxID=657014 RepID=A0A1H8YTD4_9RHOB|nr:AbrB family transcriptional regulator [Thalassovita taeanensis]SEP55416.1 hypothetical protein SAMN04488092_10195 [Thalassovita taeanensis]
MTYQTALLTLALTAFSAATGYAASLIHLPLPFMLGSLICSGTIAVFFAPRLPANYRFPMKIRTVFMVIIGVMIGTRVTADLLSSIPSMLLSFTMLTLFVFVAHGMNYMIFRRIGGYDRPTAFYSGTPGGLMESLALGEEAGADVAILTMQQFMRIIAVITMVPLGLSMWYGAPVGSASGQSLARAGADLHALPLVLLIGLGGMWIGTKIHLPAAQLTGPMLAAAIVTVSGAADLPLPQWLINLSQVVIGTSLGMRFAGLNGSLMIRAAWLTVLSVGGMLALGTLCALALTQLTDTPFDVLLISFAPGGVTEMGLVALSLHANPAIVTLHHIYRIILTVLEMSVMARFRPMNKP